MTGYCRGGMQSVVGEGGGDGMGTADEVLERVMMCVL